MNTDFLAVCDLLAQYGYLIDASLYEQWLGLFSPHCSYYVKPRENEALGLPAALIYCDSRAMLEDRIHALRIVNTASTPIAISSACRASFRSDLMDINRGTIRRLPDRARR
jgi:3-phenylpropionate/cinnamic acid dioxygenase small subunit